MKTGIRPQGSEVDVTAAQGAFGELLKLIPDCETFVPFHGSVLLFADR